MKLAAGRLIVAVALFLGWLGYLGYLVVCRPHTPDGILGAFQGRPLSLSRPQFLVSTLDVVADISGEKGDKVIVKEVLFPKSNAPVKPNDEIHVENIDRCLSPSDSLPDYNGAGQYLLPLQSLDADGGQRFEVVPTPPSPGFPSFQGVYPGPPRIYPATPQMRAEYQQIAKP